MEQAAAAIIEWGPAGVLVVVIGWAYWRERERNERLTEKRIEEMRKGLDAINSNTAALNGLADLIRVIGAKK